MLSTEIFTESVNDFTTQVISTFLCELAFIKVTCLRYNTYKKRNKCSLSTVKLACYKRKSSPYFPKWYLHS
jgi:hypothetical protein